MNEDITDKEEFELSYGVFLNTLKLATKNAETQCQTLDYYHVAGELYDELSAGEYLLSIPCNNFSNKQKFAIEQFLFELKKIPTSIITDATTNKLNLDAMKHPCWKLIRKHASILLRTLETEN